MHSGEVAIFLPKWAILEQIYYIITSLGAKKSAAKYYCMARIKYTLHWNGMFYSARVGPVKRKWVRTCILRIPRLDGKRQVRRPNNTDDMGRDFLREMSFTDAMTDAAIVLARAPIIVQEKSMPFPTLTKKNRTISRRYLKSGYAEDTAFQKLSDRWHKYDVEKRLRKMRTLAIYDNLFTCCVSDARACKCDQGLVQAMYDKVASRKSLQSALTFLFRRQA